MLNHLKKYAALHVTWIAALLVFVGQDTSKYMTTHPTVTLGGLAGALAWAAINFFVRSPLTKQ